MKGRCYNPRNKRWHRYGGRGITVCDRWLGAEGFANFLADMGEQPTGLTLNRIDNDGNYEPGNCEWATQVQQVRNQSTFKLTDGKILEIRNLFDQGISRTAISVTTGVNLSTVGACIHTIEAMRANPEHPQPPASVPD